MLKSKKEKRFDVISKYKIWFIIPVVMVLFTLIMFGVHTAKHKSVSQGLAIGVEFQGGTLLKVKLNNEQASNKKYKDAIADIIKKEDATLGYTQVSGNNTLVFKYALANTLSSEEVKQKNDRIVDQIDKLFPEIKNSQSQFISTQYIGPTATKRLVSSALISIAISTLLILIYILIRFELFSAIAAIITLSLDVLTMFCMMIVFHIQIGSAFIAAVITAVAYSINNTIVIFDRARENYKIIDYYKYDVRFILNKSVRDTLTRSIATTATTLFGILIFGIIGVSSIKEFAYPVIFSLFSGLFTSVLVAPSIFVLLKERQIKRLGQRALPFKIKK